MGTTPTNRMAKYFWPVALPILLVGAATGARATSVTAGSLLCTTSDAPENEMSLSCNFNGMAGGDGGLTGHIVIEGKAMLLSGTHVLMWSVLAPIINTSWNALVGTYRKTRAGRLSGGKNGDIVLLPSINTVRTHDRAMTVLQLQLDPSKQSKVRRRDLS